MTDWSAILLDRATKRDAGYMVPIPPYVEGDTSVVVSETSGETPFTYPWKLSGDIGQIFVNKADGLMWAYAENPNAPLTYKWTVLPAGGGAGGAVDSVNGQVGDVDLDADDIDPTATRLWLSAAERTLLGTIETGATGDQSAAEVPITDAGDYFTATDVEGALQELADAAGDGGSGSSITGEWQFNSNVGAVPGGAQVTTDTGVVYPGTTWIRFADKDKSNLDYTNLIMALGDGDRILSQQTADAGNKAIFTVAGTPTDGGSYIEVPVVVESATGSGAAWQDITIAFLYAGGDGGTGGGAVDSVNGETGVVVLDATDIDDVGPGRLWMTQAERDQISTSAGLVAEDVPITDAGGYYGSTDVEGALQAVAATVEFKVSSLDLDAIDVVTAAEFAGLTPDPATLYLLVG